MSNSAKPSPPVTGQFLVYQTDDGQLKIDVQLEGETAWLTQAHMAKLFQTTVPNVSMHLRNVYAEDELQAAATVKEFLIVRQEGNRQVSRAVEHYNLDAIISVGYRVKSAVATRFRIWATQKLREFIVKGFVLDDERLKNPDQPFDYFDELLRRIQDIRTSERRFYQKITDIYATSIDYDPNFGYAAVAHSDTDLHRADLAPSRAHDSGVRQSALGAYHDLLCGSIAEDFKSCKNPVISNTYNEAFAMARSVKCIKLGREAEGLDFLPYPGELGKRIFDNVSKEAWKQWLEQQKMLVNENRLSLADKKARDYLAQQMDKHFFGGGADAAAGYVAPDKK